MAKIDTKKIEGYENLTPEEKLKALEDFEFEEGADSKKEIERLRNSITKLSSENADWKRKYNEKLSDEEKKELEAKQEREAIELELKTLKEEKELSNAKSNYLALGYSEELAEETAKAQIAGETSKVMENHKKFLAEFQKSVLEKAMDGTPKQKNGKGTDGITLEEFRKLKPLERAKFANEHPEEYKKLYAK